MPYKDIERQRLAQREYYNRNVKKINDNLKDHKKKIKEWFTEIKKEFACLCGENHPACLEFHHRDPTKKEKCIGIMVNNGYCKKRILQELKKCDVLCCNCHRKLHYTQNQK